ncbi:GNAT family N-acetyltransferase [Egicoccus sp. AB-alg6-2]|uniref:GNAT family N-acetyltransferase n=1 Tax=Egicoccus sp. AB-alg6-2 TaxID=3242692 RepID=UPI00359ED05D
MVHVRPAEPRDLRATARIHRAQLPDGFFARLGCGFLRSYHRTFLQSEHAIALVAGDAGRPQGFLVGTLSNRDHYRRVVRRYGPGLAGRGLLALSVRPPLAWLFLRTRVRRYLRWVLRYPLRHLGRTGATADPPAETPARADSAARDDADPVGPRIAVLTHVAVDAVSQGSGAGRALVTAFLDAAREAGADEARLVTASPGPAERFYERMGWTAGAVRPGSGGSLVREYRWSLRENATS